MTKDQMQEVLDALMRCEYFPYSKTVDDAFLSEAIAIMQDAISLKAAPPIDMVLHCPNCGTQHIDRDERPSDREWSALSAGDREIQYWVNPPHKSHLCRPKDGGCGHIWRPADVPTNGVLSTKTNGNADSPLCPPSTPKEKS